MTFRLSDIHAALAIKTAMEVERTEYLDHMTFRANRRRRCSPNRSARCSV